MLIDWMLWVQRELQGALSSVENLRLISVIHWDPNPTVNQRALDDKKYIVDHFFYKKLLVLEQQMNTDVAKRMARKRVQFVRDFLARFYEEMTS
ncbi:hypothetical protein P4S72_15360 [Vibrio sp. PP-XX7]